MAAIGAWAFGTDRVSYVVTSGVSMNPVYYAGDLVIVMRADSYETGQIAAYHGGRGSTVLHRIVGGDAATGFIFKGDNNPDVDYQRPTADVLIGRAVLHVPKGGIWLRPVLSPTGLGMLGFLIISIGATATVTRRDIPRGRRKKKVKAMSRQADPWSTTLKAINRLPVALRAAGVLTLVAALLAVTLGVLGWMKPTTEIKSRSSEAARSMTFSYAATVPRSAAYDDTTVRSPDPIFRKLTNRVDVRMRYQGPAGTFDATAELSTSSGWHTTIELIPAKKFTTGSYDATANLDLTAFDNRAKAAAEATGITPSPVTITVRARVVTAGTSPFVAPLALTLAPLQMILSNGASSLTYGDAAEPGVTVDRQVWLFGMTAGAARVWAAFLLIAALIAAAVIFLIARRELPVRTRSEIERRYPELIVPVEPMASPPGKPVVNVDNFPALVKLAERYGQMILTWSRPDADDFVVRDEGITYRYRTDLENSGTNGTAAELDEGIPSRSRRRVSTKGVLTGTEDRPTSHRYPS